MPSPPTHHPPLEVSKYQNLFVKLAPDELETMPKAMAFVIGRVVKKGQERPQSLLENSWTLALTRDESALRVQPICDDRVLLRPKEPVIEMAPAHFLFSKERKEFLPAPKSDKTFAWGISLRFPALYRDVETGKIQSTARHQNGELFREIRKWVRAVSDPVRFDIHGTMIVAPFRIGKNCESDYPDLK